jgi:hypothetical protein
MTKQKIRETAMKAKFWVQQFLGDWFVQCKRDGIVTTVPSDDNSPNSFNTEEKARVRMAVVQAREDAEDSSPGPWSFTHQNSGKYLIRDAEGKLVAEIMPNTRGYDMDAANACLITASPKLRRSLAWALRQLKGRYPDSYEKTAPEMEEYSEAVAALEMAGGSCEP